MANEIAVIEKNWLALADQVKYHPAGISAVRGGIDHDG